MHFKLALSLVLAGLTVLFIVQNVAVVEVRFLFWSLSMSLSLFVFLLFAIGVIVGWLLHSYSQHRRERA
jgi:putative membrane protein